MDAMRKILKFTSLWAFFILMILPVYGQQRGNIVEYFGRETVEEIMEGEVVHVFSTGLQLPVQRSFGGLFTSEDYIFWLLANDRFSLPEQGLPADSEGEGPVWSSIQSGDNNRFEERALRNSYLYTSLESPGEETLLLDARGHTRVYINGMPYEGDHYDFGYTLIPFKLKEGLNEFIYTPGRFGRVTSRLVSPSSPVQLTLRDLTLPGIIAGETTQKWAAIRIINASENDLSGLTLTCILDSGESAEHESGNVMAMSVRKLPFLVPAATEIRENGTINATVILSDRTGSELDRTEITLRQQYPDQHHERTFLSKIDGSVQYYSVAPSTTPDVGQALVLSVHGAGVEATNQTRAYRQKDWTHVVAPTNRRPYGFNWEEWGRTDAMEVLEDAKMVYQTDESMTYLTGHSMGGHGTWQLGVTYPDRFAAIAPCAGYPDIIGYRRGEVSERLEENPDFRMIMRGASGGRTMELKRNFLQSGIYILHGDEDRVVSVEQARFMREELGKFHPNFVYYEYPGGSHWYGDESVDWFPIFDYFKWQRIPQLNEVDHVEFHTASPAISSTNYWIRINQQERSFDYSVVDFARLNDTIRGSVENVRNLTFFISRLEFENDPVIIIDDFRIRAKKGHDLTLRNEGDIWIPADILTEEKYAERSGGFKNAFDNHMVFVYATGGTVEENEWYRNKARFDAETFLYRANGSIDIVPDTGFKPGDYPDRNVIIYGNASNNSAWGKILGDVPVIVRNNEIEFGSRRLYKGDDLAALFIYPRSDSESASAGVIAGTGIRGMKAAFANDYFSGITGYPDLKIFSTEMLRDGPDGIILSGFFGYDWSIETGDFSY